MKKDIFKDIRPLIEENIKIAKEENNFNKKVMPGDQVVSPEERERVVFKYDINKKKLSSKIKRRCALSLANRLNRKEFKKNTTIIGFENIIHLKDKPFIITANHYSPWDSQIVRLVVDKLKGKNKLDIIINETNLFMPGRLGKIVFNLDMLPYADDLKYIAKTLTPALSKRVKEKKAILIYPEQEMWLDYPLPRPHKPGAAHFAYKLNIPIVPMFTTFEKKVKKTQNM